jgi:hypothetical protein
LWRDRDTYDEKEDEDAKHLVLETLHRVVAVEEGEAN